MSWALFLSLLVVWGEGAASQSPVSQPPLASASPGNTVKLACVLDRGISIGSHRIYWYQQKPPSPPRFLLQFHTDSDKGHGSGTPSRFAGSRDTSTNAFYVTVSGVLAEDEADYYCAIWHSSTWVFGGGTQLTVTGLPPVSPSVQVFAPAKEETRGSNPYTAVCLISDFRPPVIEVQWKGNNVPISSGVETSKASKQGDKYLASSYLKLSEADYAKFDSFSCEVTHQNNPPIVKTVTKSGSC